MSGADVLYRRTALGVTTLMSLMIGFAAVNPYSEATPVVRIAMLVVVILLIVGLLPGSYLQKRIQVASQAGSVRRSRLLKLVGSIAPVLGVALFSFAVYFFYSLLSQIDNTYLPAMERGEVEFSLVQYWTLTVASIVWLALTALALVRRKPTDAQAP